MPVVGGNKLQVGLKNKSRGFEIISVMESGVLVVGFDAQSDPSTDVSEPVFMSFVHIYLQEPLEF